MTAAHFKIAAAMPMSFTLNLPHAIGCRSKMHLPPHLVKAVRLKPFVCPESASRKKLIKYLLKYCLYCQLLYFTNVLLY
jgi:hypothetical protein